MFDIALFMGDTDLILSQRLGEWCGHAPVLEEDLALANTALDLLGQARLWLSLAGELEGHSRAQAAADRLWPYAGEMFHGDSGPLRAPWIEEVRATFAQATLEVPAATWAHRGGRDGIHTEALGHLLAEMQFLQRAYPGARW